MFIKSIAHIAFKCTDMEKSLHFYCDILGLKRAFEIKNDDGEPWIIYIKVCDNQFIELFYADAESNKNYTSYAHLCLAVSDIYEACETIRRYGYPIDSEPNQGKDLNLQAWITNPDGNRIELMQINENSPQSNA
jgi:lactoylglutathione lyase